MVRSMMFFLPVEHPRVGAGSIEQAHRSMLSGLQS
jgi:hypothetical protein